MRNLITDVRGVRVGNAGDARLASGVTVIAFDEPAIASVSTRGGAPGARDTTLLDPGMTVEAVNAIVLSGGSAFGLDAAGGVQAALRSMGLGFQIGGIRVPIVPQAIVFDLLNGGDKDWGDKPPYWDLGRQAAENLGKDFALGTAGGGHGATTANLKGGLGSAAITTPAAQPSQRSITNAVVGPAGPPTASSADSASAAESFSCSVPISSTSPCSVRRARSSGGACRPISVSVVVCGANWTSARKAPTAAACVSS